MEQSEKKSMSLKERFSHMSKSWKYTLITFSILVVSFAVGSGVLLAHGVSYENKVLPGVRVGGISLAGMTYEELLPFLEDMTEKIISQDIEVSFEVEGETESVMVDVSGEGAELPISVNIDTAAQELLSYGKTGALVLDAWSAFITQFVEPTIVLEDLVTFDSDEFNKILEEKLSEFGDQPIDARFVLESLTPFEYELTTSTKGFVFDTEYVVQDIHQAWGILTPAKVTMDAEISEADISKELLETAVGDIQKILEAGPLKIAHYDTHTKLSSGWSISTDDLAEWLWPVRLQDDKVGFTLDTSSTFAFLEEEVDPDVVVEPRNAVFKLNEAGTKAIEFSGHRPGVSVDKDETLKALVASFESRVSTTSTQNTAVELVVQTIEPEITTADTNDLGIEEILGTGTSDFSGSPRNRILNIKNAVYNKLHGTIVKPGEEFSLNNTLRPYTIEAGYLRELVIVGDRITPEVAGGLCQVGTTMFRTAMNSGLPITQRVNHGLVVSYYNDPSNGNPGTDATIYDGWPDFRFKNDTGSHMLITTYMNESSGDLVFSIWGKSDGRKGYYHPPVVKKWIGAGTYREIQTTDLAPGKRECQSVHPGAEVYFTYVRELPSGEKVERVFESKYRAVPATCYVGVEEITQCQEGEVGCSPGVGDSEEVESSEEDDQEQLNKILEEDFASSSDE